MNHYLFKIAHKKPVEILIKAPNLKIARLLVLDKYQEEEAKDDDYRIELKLARKSTIERYQNNKKLQKQ